MDGALFFDTKIDTKGFDDGVKEINEKGKTAGSSLKQSLGEVEATSSRAGRSLINNFKKAQTQLDETTRQAEELKRQINSIRETTISEAKEMTPRFGGATSYEAGVKEMAEFNLARNKEYQALVSQYDKVNEKLQSQQQHYTETKKAVDEYTKSLKNSSEQLKQVNKNVQETGKRTEEVVENYREVRKETNVLSKALTKLARRFKLLVVAMILRGAIRAVKEGFSDLASYSERFNKTVSEMKSSFTQARNSIATAFAPIIEALAPVIIQITDAFSKLMETVTMYTTALFTNSKTYIRAKKSAESYATSVKKVGKALASFDTIEKLTFGSSGGGGGSGSGDMFETVDIPENVIENAEKIKEIFGEIKKYLPIIAGIAGLIALLTGAFNKKNKSLEKQTKDTQAEQQALQQLVPQLAGAGAGAWAFGDAVTRLNENPFELPQVDGEGFQEQLQPATDSVGEFQYQTEMAKEGITNALEQTNIQFQTSGESIAVSNEGLKQNVAETKDSVIKDIEEVNKAYNNLPPVAVKTNEDVSISNEGIKQNVYSLRESTATNLREICKEFDLLAPSANEANAELKDSFTNFETNTGELKENTKLNMKQIALALALFPLLAFQKTSTDLATWGTSTSENIVTWGSNLVENIGKTAEAMRDNFVSALADMWENFAEFTQATGGQISDWWKEHKSFVRTVGVALVVARLIAAPFTGGQSLNPAIPYLAKGTVVPPNTGEFTAVLGDNKRETEVVSPLSTMKQAMKEAMQEYGTQDLVADVRVYWNGEEVYNQIEKVKARRGTKLVRGGTV